MSVFMRTGNRSDMEREILRAVKQRGYCYIKNQLLTDQLESTTDEQLTAWKNSFAEQQGLSCEPYQEEVSPGLLQYGAIFKAIEKA